MTRERGCDGKVAFRSFQEADRSLSFAMRHDGAADTPMGVYRCRFCNHFHIGHARVQPSKQQQDLRKAKRA